MRISNDIWTVYGIISPRQDTCLTTATSTTTALPNECNPYRSSVTATTPPNPNSKPSPTTLALSISLSTILILVILLTIGICYIRRKRRIEGMRCAIVEVESGNSRKGSVEKTSGNDELVNEEKTRRSRMSSGAINEEGIYGEAVAGRSGGEDGKGKVGVEEDEEEQWMVFESRVSIVVVDEEEVDGYEGDEEDYGERGRNGFSLRRREG
ncbi:unnamed protein product [Periconia digitata]|uniref:Transmembrane protein n=1 Tax=Periconia digitata TaxID=1303443 RepID=A0A9W4U3Q6_9PLEO|nr:unnamed protein product [Periconia digitata]